MSEWIKCSEELPPLNVMVRVSRHLKNERDLAIAKRVLPMYNGELLDGWAWKYLMDNSKSKVWWMTYNRKRFYKWQPLPEPPKEEA